MSRTQIIISDFLLLIEYMTYFICVLRRTPLKCKNLKRLAPIAVCLAAYTECIIFYPNKTYTFLIIEVLSFFLVYFILEETLFESVKIWTIGCWFLSLFESFIDIIVFVNINNRFIKMSLNSIISIGLFIIYYYLFGRKMEKVRWNNKIWGMFVGVVFVVELMISYFSALVVYIGGDLRPNTYKMGSLIVALGGIAIYIILFSFVYYFNQKEDYRSQTEISKRFNLQQKEYFTNLLETDKNTRSFRHDIVNHLMSLKSLEEKGEYGQLRIYLKDLLQDLDNVSDKQYKVGNDVMDITLNHYLGPLKDKCDIEVVGFIDDNLIITDKDLCTILSNLMKNAVEALEDVDNKVLKIKVEEGHKYFRITIENTFSGYVKRDGQGNIVTNKSDNINHGIGLRNVRTVVEKYNGKMDTITEGNIFRVEIFLPALI